MSHVPGGLVYKRLMNVLRRDAGLPINYCLNGPVWSLAPIPVNKTFDGFCVAFGNGAFIASYNNSGQPGILYSTDDGSTWNIALIPSTYGVSGLLDISFSNGVFVVTVNAVQCIRSTDFNNWALIGIPGGPNSYIGHAFDGNVVIIGNVNPKYSLDNGLTWNSSLSSISGSIHGPVCSNSRVAIIPTNTGFAKSSDGIVWSNHVLGWNGVRASASDGNRLTFLEKLADKCWFTDDDGLTWNSSTLPGFGNTEWNCLVYRNGYWFAGSQGKSLGFPPRNSISSDCLTWSQLPNQPGIDFTGGVVDMVYNGNKWVGQRRGTRNQIWIGECV